MTRSRVVIRNIRRQLRSRPVRLESAAWRGLGTEAGLRFFSEWQTGLGISMNARTIHWTNRLVALLRLIPLRLNCVIVSSQQGLVIEIPSGHRFGFHNLRHALTSFLVEIGNRLQDDPRHAALGRPFNPAQGLRALAHGQAHGGSGKDDRRHVSEPGNCSTVHPVDVGDRPWAILPVFCRQISTKFLRMMVARDGVEPPTPAFSGLDTAVAILLNLLTLAPSFSLFSVYLLEQ